MRVFLTGIAGFIGFYVAKKLADNGHEVLGVDILNDYYDPSLKYERLKILGFDYEHIDSGKVVQSNRYDNLSFVYLDILDKQKVLSLFSCYKFTHVCHLLAQAGIRDSIENPDSYISVNIVGFFNVLDACRIYKENIEHFVYASTSAVYGLNEKMPSSEDNITDHPLNLYAASKKSNEVIAHAYSASFNIPTTGLRFFTVYGPYGRPDMALYLFAAGIINKTPINVFNNGNMARDFTYIDDVVDGLYNILRNPAESDSNFDVRNPNSSSSRAPYRIYNIGTGHSIKIKDFINELEVNLGNKAYKKFLPMQKSEVVESCCDISKLKNDLDYEALTSIKDGIKKFADWYKSRIVR
ncbi:NAD-dependent epimerase/dehydratase family protein [Borrelia miyamotoi]|uniref:GDP-mannose 4,6-dehydratase n=1 Tax=Borrelia miyamotoi TaxID=47466 RepID=A0AAQ3AH05_9SPIR|nr:NAD-dependent epimerase/dehydratase family protein [Borrelia miyamotoi]AGT27418.1 UDP-glucuronic acid epimerase [Borrelia miyamotoi LB-2001]AJA58596.1 capsule biosynthesis protein CapI [Borrelia miyamotoi]AOW95675.1 capsule biosynthesis protein CapI [Borrelia miyamotoi]QTL83559.1 GDP-mannose 4,6-dehydratase [Borrelia miyamotoi]WAZ85139.1 GDP-mannose 4,6-dehydratase [Borrelia miyamotoi]